MPNEDPNKGWNRASIQYKSRRPYEPSISAEDLLMPSGFGSFRMLWMSAFMALCVTLLYFWTLLFLLNVFVPLSGEVYGAVLASALVVFTLFFYILGTHETRRDRELAARL